MYYQQSEPSEKKLHILFEFSVILKGIHALIETVSAFVVLFISQSFIQKTAIFLTREELSEDPKDVISHYILNAAGSFSVETQHFAFLYLLLHGVVKLFLVWGLLDKKKWAYPASIAVLAIFVIYQLYRYSITFSPWLLALTVFDILVIVLVYHEYRFHYSRMH